MFESPESNLINESLQKDIDRALDILTKKESYVIKSLFGIGCKIKNKEDLAKEMCFTEERIRQLGSLAQKKIANSDKAKKLLLKYI
jgi:RNA polymerase primary sigma factor